MQRSADCKSRNAQDLTSRSAVPPRLKALLSCISLSLLCLLPTLDLGCKRGANQIALLPPTTGIPLWDAAHAGAVRGATACGMRVHYDGPSHEGDLQAQLMSFDRFRKEGYAGIILAPAQNRAFRTPVDRAIAAGMPIVILGSDLGIQSPSLAYVLTDDTVGGRLAANRMAQILPKGGRLAVMGLTPDHSSTQERDRSFENELSQTHPSLHVVERSRGSANVAQEEQIAEDLLAGSGQVDGILALTSTATRGAYYAVMSQPRVRHIAIIGFDQDLLPPIRAGQIDAVIAQPAHTMGELAARTICQLRNGTTTNARVVVAPLLVTRQSIDDPGVTTQLDGAWWDAEKK